MIYLFGLVVSVDVGKKDQVHFEERQWEDRVTPRLRPERVERGERKDWG